MFKCKFFHAFSLYRIANRTANGLIAWLSFYKKVLSSRFNCIESELLIVCTRKDNNWDRRLFLSNQFNGVEPCAIWKIQVQHNGIKIFFMQFFECLSQRSR